MNKKQQQECERKVLIRVQVNFPLPMWCMAVWGMRLTHTLPCFIPASRFHRLKPLTPFYHFLTFYLTIHTHIPLHIPFTTGHLIASTAEDGSVRMWDPFSGAEVVTVTDLPGPRYPGLADPYHGERPCVWDRTGNVLASGSEDGGLQVFGTNGAQVGSAAYSN